MAKDEIVDIFHGNTGTDILKIGYDILEGVAGYWGQSGTLTEVAKWLGKKFGVNIIPTSQDILKAINEMTNGLLKQQTADYAKLTSMINAMPLSKGGQAKYHITDRNKQLSEQSKKLSERERKINQAVETAKAGASSLDFAATTSKAKLGRETLNDLESKISKI